MYTQPASVTLQVVQNLSVILCRVNVSVNLILLEASAALAGKDFTCIIQVVLMVVNPVIAILEDHHPYFVTCTLDSVFVSQV